MNYFILKFFQFTGTVYTKLKIVIIYLIQVAPNNSTGKKYYISQ